MASSLYTQQLTFTSQNSNTLLPLLSCSFTDSITGWAAGSGGKILFTSNSGQNWVDCSMGMGLSTYSIFFNNSLTGWIGAYTNTAQTAYILKTVNGGVNWSVSHTGNDLPKSIYFINSNTGWVCGTGGIVLHTTDSGVNWISQFIGQTNYLNKIYFADNNTGCLSVPCLFIKT